MVVQSLFVGAGTVSVLAISAPPPRLRSWNNVLKIVASIFQPFRVRTVILENKVPVGTGIHHCETTDIIYTVYYSLGGANFKFSEEKQFDVERWYLTQYYFLFLFEPEPECSRYK